MYNANNGYGIFDNKVGALLTKTGGTGDTYFQSTCTYINSGTITINSGSLSLQGNGTQTGTVNNGANGALYMPSGTHHIMAGALFTGTGVVGVNGGHFSVEVAPKYPS